jgi:hypothetical protein
MLRRWIWLLLFATAAVFPLSVLAAEPGHNAAVVHVVLVWLKEPGNPEHRQRIIDASRQFKTIPGVIDVSVGEVVTSNRPIVDDSFDVGLYLTFSSVEAMQTYLADDRHQRALREIFRPLSERYIVYDFLDDGT